MTLPLPVTPIRFWAALWLFILGTVAYSPDVTGSGAGVLSLVFLDSLLVAATGAGASAAAGAGTSAAGAGAWCGVVAGVSADFWLIIGVQGSLDEDAEYISGSRPLRR